MYEYNTPLIVTVFAILFYVISFCTVTRQANGHYFGGTLSGLV